MAEYLCAWRIDIAADTPEEAAELAQRFMREQLHESTWHVIDKETHEQSLVNVFIGGGGDEEEEEA